MENTSEDILIKQNLVAINKSLIQNNQYFKDWDAYQQYFKVALDKGLLRTKDAFSFAWSLYTNTTMCLTKKEDEELEKKKEGLRHFIKKIADPDYIKEEGITKENLGTLYEEELSKATSPKVLENNTSYTKHSSNR